MDKRKKAIIAVIAIIVLLIILGIVWYFVFNNNTNKSNNINSNINNENNSQTENSKISKLYENLQKTNVFSFEAVLDENNKMYYAKSNNMAYIENTKNGEKTKYLIKDGTTNLLVEDTKTYYTYANNQTNLNMVIRGLEKVKGLKYETGKEKIENKNYTYEEYALLTDFAIGDFTKTEEENNIKTRFYFKGDELVYIKTIQEDKQELLKINTSYDVKQDLFNIPEDYKKA